MDGSESWLISCWTRCCNLVGRLIVVKAESVLSRLIGLRQVLDLNVYDVEVRGVAFGEVLALTDQIYMWYFCVVGEILLKYCVVDGDTIGCTATGFGVVTLGILKMGNYCYFSSPEAL